MRHKSNQKVYSIYIYHLISENEIHIGILQFFINIRVAHKKSLFSIYSKSPPDLIFLIS